MSQQILDFARPETNPQQLHFWRRVEGDLPSERVFARNLWAVLRPGGAPEHYHVAALESARAETERMLSEGVWHWQYLGVGVRLSV